MKSQLELVFSDGLLHIIDQLFIPTRWCRHFCSRNPSTFLCKLTNNSRPCSANTCQEVPRQPVWCDVYMRKTSCDVLWRCGVFYTRYILRGKVVIGLYSCIHKSHSLITYAWAREEERAEVVTTLSSHLSIFVWCFHCIMNENSTWAVGKWPWACVSVSSCN